MPISHSVTSLLKRCGIALALLLPAGDGPAATVPGQGAGPAAEFCADCVDEKSARQRASMLAGLMMCRGRNDRRALPIAPGPRCRSRNLDLLLVNPFSGNLYPYRLGIDAARDRPLVRPRALSDGERAAARAVVDIHWALRSANFIGVIGAEDMASPASSSARNDSSCPEGTAFEHVLNPELRSRLFAEIEQEWLRTLAPFRDLDVSVSRRAGIDVSVGPVRLTVGWSRSAVREQASLFAAGFVFDVSEVTRDSAVLEDIVLFQVERAGFSSGQFDLDAEFDPGLSRAAGRPVNQLLTGQTVIDHPCVLAKLEEYADRNPLVEFHEYGPGGPLFDFPDLSDDSGGELCTKRLCATVCMDGRCTCQFEVAVLTRCET